MGNRATDRWLFYAPFSTFALHLARYVCNAQKHIHKRCVKTCSRIHFMSHSPRCTVLPIYDGCCVPIAVPLSCWHIEEPTKNKYSLQKRSGHSPEDLTSGSSSHPCIHAKTKYRHRIFIHTYAVHTAYRLIPTQEQNMFGVGDLSRPWWRLWMWWWLCCIHISTSSSSTMERSPSYRFVLAHRQNCWHCNTFNVYLRPSCHTFFYYQHVRNVPVPHIQTRTTLHVQMSFYVTYSLVCLMFECVLRGVDVCNIAVICFIMWECGIL